MKAGEIGSRPRGRGRPRADGRRTPTRSPRASMGLCWHAAAAYAARCMKPIRSSGPPSMSSEFARAKIARPRHADAMLAMSTPRAAGGQNHRICAGSRASAAGKLIAMPEMGSTRPESTLSRCAAGIPPRFRRRERTVADAAFSSNKRSATAASAPPRSPCAAARGTAAAPASRRAVASGSSVGKARTVGRDLEQDAVRLAEIETAEIEAVDLAAVRHAAASFSRSAQTSYSASGVRNAT